MKNFEVMPLGVWWKVVTGKLAGLARRVRFGRGRAHYVVKLLGVKKAVFPCRAVRYFPRLNRIKLLGYGPESEVIWFSLPLDRCVISKVRKQEKRDGDRNAHLGPLRSHDNRAKGAGALDV